MNRIQVLKRWLQILTTNLRTCRDPDRQSTIQICPCATIKQQNRSRRLDFPRMRIWMFLKAITSVTPLKRRCSRSAWAMSPSTPNRPYWWARLQRAKTTIECPRLPSITIKWRRGFFRIRRITLLTKNLKFSRALGTLAWMSWGRTSTTWTWACPTFSRRGKFLFRLATVASASQNRTPSNEERKRICNRSATPAFPPPTTVALTFSRPPPPTKSWGRKLIWPKASISMILRWAWMEMECTWMSFGRARTLRTEKRCWPTRRARS